jgi:hypothetical protein
MFNIGIPKVGIPKVVQPAPVSPPKPPNLPWGWDPEGVELEAEVVEPLAPYRTGQVKWRGTFWRSRTTTAITLNCGDTVRVLHYEKGLLWVELLCPQEFLNTPDLSCDLN